MCGCGGGGDDGCCYFGGGSFNIDIVVVEVKLVGVAVVAINGDIGVVVVAIIV